MWFTGIHIKCAYIWFYIYKKSFIIINLTYIRFSRRAFVLPLGDVINHMFGDPTFARFVGTRTFAMLQSPWYRRLDVAHGMAISTLASPDLRLPTPPPDPGAAVGSSACAGASDSGPASSVADADPREQSRNWEAPVGRSPLSVPQSPSDISAVLPEPVHAPDAPESPTADPPCGAEPTWDPDDMGPVHADFDASAHIGTAHGETMVLLFGLFVDGVQLHNAGRSTTTVFSLKCLDLPGFLANTDLACYTLAFVDGPKEPTNMTQLVLTILHQFKIFEPTGVTDSDGEFLRIARILVR